MNKKPFYILLEIFIITILLSFSIPMRESIFNSTENLDEMIATLNQKLTIKTNDVKMTSLDHYDFSPVSILIENSTVVNKNAELMLLYSKNSTLDYHVLEININNIDYNLTDLYITEDQDYYIFQLDSLFIESLLNKEYFIYYNIKNDTIATEYINKHFDSKIEIVEF